MAQVAGSYGVAPDSRSSMASGLTRALMAAGVIGGSGFTPVALFQAMTRPGFDIRRHALSLLLLGDLGWVQALNFVTCGLLVLAFALGTRRMIAGQSAGTWGPYLLAGFGAGTVIAGIFAPDPALGFPPGTPTGVPTTLSWHNWVHTAGFMVAFTSITAACLVFRRRFRYVGQRRWARYCGVTGIATPVLAVAGIVILPVAGLAFIAAGALAWVWVALLAASLMERAASNSRPSVGYC